MRYSKKAVYMQVDSFNLYLKDLSNIKDVLERQQTKMNEINDKLENDFSGLWNDITSISRLLAEKNYAYLNSNLQMIITHSSAVPRQLNSAETEALKCFKANARPVEVNTNRGNGVTYTPQENDEKNIGVGQSLNDMIRSDNATESQKKGISGQLGFQLGDDLSLDILAEFAMNLPGIGIGFAANIDVTEILNNAIDSLKKLKNCEEIKDGTKFIDKLLSVYSKSYTFSENGQQIKISDKFPVFSKFMKVTDFVNVAVKYYDTEKSPLENLTGRYGIETAFKAGNYMTKPIPALNLAVREANCIYDAVNDYTEVGDQIAAALYGVGLNAIPALLSADFSSVEGIGQFGSTLSSDNFGAGLGLGITTLLPSTEEYMNSQMGQYARDTWNSFYHSLLE